MDFREKVALILLAVILYETVCSNCMPQSLKDSPFERYINKQKYSPNYPKTYENGRNLHRFQDDLTKKNKLSSKISPIDVSDSFINNLKREKRMKRKLQRAQKIYTRHNDENLGIPASFHNQGTPFYLSEVGLFPEVQYPLTASDTWTSNYWNSLPSNNHDRFFNQDAYLTGRKKPNNGFDVFKKTTANNSKTSPIGKKSEKIQGAKSNKIVRQTSANQGQRKNVDIFEQKDENDIEKYLMETPKFSEKENISTGTNEKIQKSKKKQVSDNKKGLNHNISNDIHSNKTQESEINLNIKKQNITSKNNKTNASIEKINTAFPQEKKSKVTEQKNTTKDKNPVNLTKIEKTFSPKPKDTGQMKSVSKKSVSSIKDITLHFSKLITKLEQLSNKQNIISSTTSTNQVISFSPTNGTSNSSNQEGEPETKVAAQNNLTNIVETNISQENMEVPRDEKLNLVQSISDKTTTSDERAQTSFKSSEEELPFSLTDYVVRNQLLEVLSDPKLSISSLRNGILNILEEIDSKSEEELDETSLIRTNESTYMLPVMDKYLKEDKSLFPDQGISYLDEQDSLLQNFNEAILPCTNTFDNSSEIMFDNNMDDNKSVDMQHSEKLCMDVPQNPHHFVTGKLSENLRNVISEPSSSKSLIEDLSEIIRLLTIWNSHIDDSDENVHQTTEIDTIDGYIPNTTELLSEGGSKTAATNYSYISDSKVVEKSIKNETENSYDINKSNVTDHIDKGVDDCTIEDIFKTNGTDRLNEDMTNYSCENNHDLNDSENYSCKDYYQHNETEYSNENMADHTCDDIHEPNTIEHINEDVANSFEYIENNEDEAIFKNKADTRENILKHNVSEDVVDYSIEDICSFNTTDPLNGDLTEKLCEDVYKPYVSSCESVMDDSCENGPEINKADNSNEHIHSLKETIISSEGVNDNSYEEICKLNVTDPENQDKTDHSFGNIHKHNLMVYSSEDANDRSCEDFFKFNESKHLNEDMADTREYISKPNINKYSNEGVIDDSYEYISTTNITDYYSNEDEIKNSCKGIHEPNATVYSYEDMNDCSNEDISVNVSNEEATQFSSQYIHRKNVTEYSNEDETEYSREHIGSSAIENSSEVTNFPYLNNSKLKSNVTDHSEEIFNDFSSEDIVISNVIKRKVKNMAKMNMLEHYTKDTDKYNITNYFSKTVPQNSSNDLVEPNTTNNVIKMLPNTLDNIPKAKIDDSNERIPKSSEANYLNEDFDILSDSPTIYHIPFEKLTNAANDQFSTIPMDVDDQTVNNIVTDEFTLTSHRDLNDTTPLSLSPSFTYEVNEEIPENELVIFEKFDKITSTEDVTDKEIISNANFTEDYLPIFTFNDVFESLSDNSENLTAFDSTLPSFDENILKLHNETETKMFANDLPTITNRDKKSYDEVCPITGNELSENQCFMIDDPSNLNNTRNSTNERKELRNPVTKNMTELFGDQENPDFYDFILYPEEYEYTETSENNDTRELNSDTTLDFTDYTVLPEDTTFSEYNEENYIETLVTTASPFDQYDDAPEQNEESKVSEGSSESNQIIHNIGNRYVTQDITFEQNLEDKSSTDYTSLPEDPKLTKYFDSYFGEEHEFRPLYERNVKPLLHRDLVQHHPN